MSIKQRLLFYAIVVATFPVTFGLYVLRGALRGGLQWFKDMEI